MLGVRERGAVVGGARLRVLGQVLDDEVRVAEEEEVGLLLVAFMFVDFSL